MRRGQATIWMAQSSQISALRLRQSSNHYNRDQRFQGILKLKLKEETIRQSSDTRFHWQLAIITKL